MVSVHLASLTQDEKTERDVQRRRQEEEARKERIFCPRQLKMGLDTEALAAQVQQKRDFQKTEKEKNVAADQQALYFGAVLELQRAEIEHERRQSLIGAADFNRTAARKKEVTNELLAEVAKPLSVEESRAAAGPSSLLVFEGEDLTFACRTKKQQRQQREALQEHLFQQALLQQQEDKRASQYAEAAALSCRAAESVHQRQMKEEAERRLSTAKANLMLAEERRQRDAAYREKEMEAEGREIENNLRDPFLAEGRQDLIKGDSSLSSSLPRAPTGCLGANRDGFKGFPLEVLEAAAAKNAERRQAALERKKDEERINQQWASYAETQRRLNVVLEREKERRRRQTAMAVAEANAHLEEEQKQRETFRNRELYRGAIGLEYNKYFSTTSR